MEKQVLKELLIDQQQDRARYSKLKDRLYGQDDEADELLREIDHLQLEIIADLSDRIING